MPVGDGFSGSARLEPAFCLTLLNHNTREVPSSSRGLMTGNMWCARWNVSVFILLSPHSVLVFHVGQKETRLPNTSPTLPADAPAPPVSLGAVSTRPSFPVAFAGLGLAPACVCPLCSPSFCAVCGELAVCFGWGQTI